MQLEYCRSQTKNELEQILSLQEENLFKNISCETRSKEGFVTVEHSLDILERMNEVCPHIIVKHDEKVIGYALCMHPKFSNEIEILKPMFREINMVLPDKTTYMAMGQICIDKGYRKMGVFRKLYETMKNSVQSEFQYIVTEVDTKNIRSLNAHYSVGFVDLKTYSSKDQKWKLIILK